MKFKKLLSVMLTAAMAVSAAAVTSGCSKKKDEGEKASQVMTVSLNPEMEFVLNKDGKVISVNAINEDGNYILSVKGTKEFEGKTREEAVEIFISASKEAGFFATANKTTDGKTELEISFSGDDAQKAYDELKAKISETLSKENIEAKKAEIEDYINKKYAEIAPWIEEAEAKKISAQEKLQAIYESRKETAGIYSEGLKKAYYAGKAAALEAAKLEYIKEKTSALTAAAIESVNVLYKQASEGLEKARATYLTNEDSAYNQAFKAFIEKKTEFINYYNYYQQLPEEKKTEDMKAYLEAKKTALDEAETTLVNVYDTANKMVDEAQKQLILATDKVINAIMEFDKNAQKYLNEASEKGTALIVNYTDKFEKDYKANEEAAKKAWEDMKKELEKGYNPTPIDQAA